MFWLLRRPHKARDKFIPSRKTGCFRPRKIAEEVLAALKRQVKKYPAMTAGQLRQMVPESSLLFCST
jgi:hypothetical protein